MIYAAKAKGLVTIGGECSTVGVAGGYTQGGGHSALSSNFGKRGVSILKAYELFKEKSNINRSWRRQCS